MTFVVWFILATCKYCLVDFTPPKNLPHAKRCSSNRCKQDYKNEWGRNNPKCKQDWITKNPEKRKEASKAYRQRNMEFYREYASLRTRHTLQSKPKWLDEFELFWIQELYHLAKLRGKEVDHIIPIKHDKVCGLHVPWNMQFLTRSENARKSNKFDEDVVGVVE